MYSLERNLELNKNSQQVDIIGKAKIMIRESLETCLTIQEIAKTLGVSYSSFRKLFKEHTGIAPAMYQHNLRLQLAKELLTSTDESIKEIAYRLNFGSPDYFSSKFKAKTGMKPSDYRLPSRKKRKSNKPKKQPKKLKKGYLLLVLTPPLTNSQEMA